MEEVQGKLSENERNKLISKKEKSANDYLIHAILSISLKKGIFSVSINMLSAISRIIRAKEGNV